MSEPPSLLKVATAIADLTSVDWQALEADAERPSERLLLRRLRLLDRIVRACAEIVPPGTAVPSADASVEHDIVPPTWGPFTIHDRIGRGTFGNVYRAHDRRLDRVVALKLLRREETGPVASGVIREGQLLAKARHPNVVTVYGAERIDDRVGVWMEFVDGRTLEEELRASGPLPPAAVVDVGIALCSALAAVHGAGVLHRDLKAQNVMRASDGRLLLTDFGAGRAYTEGNDDRKRIVLAGTPLYLAPELLDGAPATVSSDVYSLGVLLYHLATGAFPVRGGSLRELREASLRGERVGLRAYRDSVPKALAAVIDRATHPDPAARFDSAEAFGKALQRSRRTRSWLPATLLAAATIAVVGLVGLNAVWFTMPPPRIVSRSVILDNAADVGPVFARGDRLYFWRGNSLYSVIPGRPDSERTEADASSPFIVVDMIAASHEYLALKPQASGSSELWVLPASGQPRRVGRSTCHLAAWSPDGRSIACADGGRLTVVTADGRESSVLSEASPHRVAEVAWSPRGDLLRFTLDSSTRDRYTSDLYEVNTDGTGLRRVLAAWRDVPEEYHGTWVLNGRYFVFASVTGWQSALWVRREPRGVLDWIDRGPWPLTEGPESFGRSIVASPDGTTIYTVVDRRLGTLERYNTSARRFEPYLGGLSAISVTFSPDRRSVAYIKYPDMKLWRADASGRNARPLVEVPIEMKGAAWSPDGRWIAFVSRLEGEQARIFLLPTDGSGPPQPIAGVEREQGNPSWSPDGRRLCYGDVPTRFGIPDGGEVLRIYDLETEKESPVPGSEGLWTCRWSPDGRFIAGLRIDLGPEEMMINLFDTTARTWSPLPNAHHVNEPSWSRDSRFVYYDTEGQTPAALRRVRIEDGTVEDLATLVDHPLAYHWSGLSPDDEPLVLRNVGWARLYALRLGAR